MQQFPRHALWKQAIHGIITAHDHGPSIRLIDPEIVHCPIGKGALLDVLAEDLNDAEMPVILQNPVIDVLNLIMFALKGLHEVAAIMHQEACDPSLMIVGFGDIQYVPDFLFAEAFSSCADINKSVHSVSWTL